MSFYDADLAYIHDAGHTRFASDAAPAILDLLRSHDVSGRVLDLGCGSGVLASRLLDEGYVVTGIDVSGAMIRLARERVPGATFLRASFHDADLPGCRAVVSVGECFNYLKESAGHSLARLFGRIHGALDPGGVLVFDMALTGRAGPTGTHHATRQGDGWAMMSVATEADGVLERRITAFVEDGGAWRRSDEVHRLLLPGEREVLRSLEAAGFDARRLGGYEGVTFPAGYGAFMGVRRP